MGGWDVAGRDWEEATKPTSRNEDKIGISGETFERWPFKPPGNWRDRAGMVRPAKIITALTSPRISPFLLFPMMA
jgi:hypothetical protein